MTGPAGAAPGTLDYDIELTFDVGDPESVARVTFQRVPAGSVTEAAQELLDRLDRAGAGFTSAELLQVVVTRSDPGVARNLLEHRGSPPPQVHHYGRPQ